MFEEYKRWIYERYFKRTQWKFHILFEILCNKEFVYMVMMDRNREDDGLELRGDWIEMCHRNPVDYLTLTKEATGCRVMEMLVALTVRALGELDKTKTGIEFEDFFFIMLHNLGLDEFDNEFFSENFDCELMADHILNRFMERTYKRNGDDGGLFGDLGLEIDVRKMEIWAQMQRFVVKNQLF